jgi:hypothetical protein
MGLPYLQKLYERLITGTLPIVASMQKRMITYLIREKEFGLLGRMATRTDLSPESEVTLRDRSEALVLAGWASRPGLTADELIARLGDETRVSTLLPLAKMEGLPEEVYATISRNRSVKLVDALLENPSVSVTIRLAMVDAIVASLDKKSDWSVRGNLATYTCQNDEILTAIAFGSHKPNVVAAALDALVTGVPGPLLDDIIERVDSLLENADGEARNKGGSMLLATLARNELTAPQLKKLRAVANTFAKNEVNHWWAYGDISYRDVKKMLSPIGRETLSKVKALADCTDEVQSRKIFRELVPPNKRFADEGFAADAILDAVSRNTALPASLVKPLFDGMLESAKARLMRTWMARGDLAVVAEVASEEYSEPHWLETMADPTPVLAAVVAHVLSKDEVIPNWVLSHRAIHSCPETAIALLPWRCLSEVRETCWFDSGAERSATGDAVVDAAHKRIAERLGDNPLKWEVFETLADEFEGSLPDLLDAVDAI